MTPRSLRTFCLQHFTPKHRRSSLFGKHVEIQFPKSTIFNVLYDVRQLAFVSGPFLMTFQSGMDEEDPRVPWTQDNSTILLTVLGRLFV